MKNLISILLVSFTLVACSDLVDNDDVTYPRNTLSIYAGSSSVGDPDFAGIATSLFDTVEIPFIEQAESGKENDIVQEYSWALSMRQYTAAIVDGFFTDDAGVQTPATPGHIAFGAAQLMWNLDLENRVKYYQKSQHFYLNQAPSVLLYSLEDLSARFVGWNESTESIRTVFQHETTLRAVDAIVDNKDVVLTFSSTTPNGKTIFSAEKTAAGIQISGRMYRILYRYDVSTGDPLTTSEHQLIVFMSRISSVAVMTGICQMEVNATNYETETCNPDPADTILPLCDVGVNVACKEVATYVHPAVGGNLETDSTTVAIADPTLQPPLFWTADEDDHFRLSL